MTSLTPLFMPQFFDDNSVEMVGGQLFTYAAGTTTKVSVYTDITGANAFTNPIILNSRGEPTYNGASTAIWLSPGIAYKFVLSPSTDTDPPTDPFWTVDNISTGSDAIGLSYLTDTGTTNALAVALSPTPSSYTAGMQFFVQVANTTTGATTINVSGLGAQNVTINGAPLNAGALQVNQVYLLIYDGTAFEVESIPGPGNWVTNGDLAFMPAGTIKANTTGSPAAPQDVSLSALQGTFASGQYGEFAMATLPAGWLLANGAAVSRTTYANLFTAIGTTYGTGDGTTTFNLPQLQGYFLRGINTTGSGPDPSRALNTQTDAVQGHIHFNGVSSNDIGASTYGITTTDAPGHATGCVAQNAGGNTYQGETSGPENDGINGAPRTAIETRPANVSCYIGIHI